MLWRILVQNGNARRRRAVTLYRVESLVVYSWIERDLFARFVSSQRAKPCIERCSGQPTSGTRRDSSKIDLAVMCAQNPEPPGELWACYDEGKPLLCTCTTRFTTINSIETWHLHVIFENGFDVVDAGSRANYRVHASLLRIRRAY